jgi:tryptophan synthase beta chain
MKIDYSRFPDVHGRFGDYGGMFVAETLMAPLAELTDAYLRLRRNPAFVAELDHDLKHYVGRPSPIYHAERLSKKIGGANIQLRL